MKAIKWYKRVLRENGYKVPTSCNGWQDLAMVIGVTTATKGQAKSAIKEKFRTHFKGEFQKVHPRKPKPYKPTHSNPASDSFLTSYEWRRVRMVVLKRDGAKCACCNATRESGLQMHVDHIKPRKIYPELALDPSNLQVLCEVCNHGKGNWDMTDWRTKQEIERRAGLIADICETWGEGLKIIDRSR